MPAAGGTRGDERCDYFVQVTITTHDVLRLNIGGSTQAVLQGKDTPQSKMHDVLVAASPQPSEVTSSRENILRCCSCRSNLERLLSHATPNELKLRNANSDY